MAAKAQKQETCITATLTRGRVYVYKNVHFERGKAVEVDEELAYELEEMCDIITDSENEEFEKYLFEVDYDAPKPQPEEVDKHSRRRLKRQRVAESASKTKPLKKKRPKRLRANV